MWFSVCSRRTIIERIGFSLLSLLHTFFEDIIICPEFFRIFFSFYEIHIRIDFLIHCVTPFFFLKRISLARFSACGGSLLRHVSIPTQCEPRGAFLSYRNEVFYMIKKLPPCNRTRVNHYRFIPPLTHTNIRVPFNGGKPASLTFLSQFYLNRKFQAATPE